MRAHLLVSTPNRIFQFFSLPWWYGFLNTCARTAVYSVVQYMRVGQLWRWLRALWRYLALLPQPLGLLAVDVALHAGLSPGDEHGVPQGESSQSHRHRAARQEEGHHLRLGTQPGRARPSRVGSGRRSPGQNPEEDDGLVGGGLCEGAGFRRRLIGALREGSTSCVSMTVSFAKEKRYF